jgi:type II secretory pathway pseudopilin PulG
MTTELKYKLLQYLQQRDRDGGFTMIEWTIILGILLLYWLYWIDSSFWLPGPHGPRQAEAKVFVGSVNRSQQAYYLENGEFASDLETLKAGIPSETDSYTYAITEGGEGSTQAGIEAVAQNDEVLSFAGLVFVDAETGDAQAVACQTTEASKEAPAIDAMLPEKAACGSEEAVME